MIKNWNNKKIMYAERKWKKYTNDKKNSVVTD